MYNPKIWYDGDIVTSGGLNNIEQGIAQNAHDIEDLQGALGGDLESYVNDWLDSHPEATTTVQDGSLTYKKLVNGTLGFVTPEMFGAKGDGNTNDFEAFKSCAAYANSHGCYMFCGNKVYYIDPTETIELLCNVKCNSSVFLVGENTRSDLPVFRYSHDEENNNNNVLLSSVLDDNHTVKSAYSNKFFVIDTKIAYGTPISNAAPTDETIKESCFTKDTDTKIYFANDVSSHLSSYVDVTNISEMNETGYTFEGGVIKQKNETGYGIYFLNVRRNNMTIKNVQVAANNTLGQGTVFYCQYCNNLTFDDIKSYSTQPNVYTYEIGIYYSANVLINNFKGFNNWSSIATRGLKNYTLRNSISTTFDCHWNAYGTFLCDTCYLYKDAHIGYGCGDFIIKNTIVNNSIATRMDFLQTWYGNITIDDVKTNKGFALEISSDTSSGYDPFFNTFDMPDVFINNMKATNRSLYIKIPDSNESRINSNAHMTISDSNLVDVAVPYTNKKYKVILRGIPFVVGLRSNIDHFGDIKYDDNMSTTGTLSLTSGIFSSSSIVMKKKNGIVSISFTGVLSNTLNANTVFATLPPGFYPNENTYGAAVYNTTCMHVLVKSNGQIQLTQAISEASNRLTFSIVYVQYDIF